MLRHLKDQKPLSYLEIVGDLCHNPDTIRHHIVGYYEGIFSKRLGRDPLDFLAIDSLVPNLVSHEDNVSLRNIHI